MNSKETKDIKTVPEYIQEMFLEFLDKKTVENDELFAFAKNRWKEIYIKALEYGPIAQIHYVVAKPKDVEYDDSLSHAISYAEDPNGRGPIQKLSATEISDLVQQTDELIKKYENQTPSWMLEKNYVWFVVSQCLTPYSISFSDFFNDHFKLYDDGRINFPITSTFAN